MRILVVQLSDLDPPGRLGEWLEDAGAQLRVVPGSEVAANALEEYQALVVLGGEMGALDDAEFPWLSNVRKLLSNAVSKSFPVLAMCLGAQLLAVASGGQVRVGRKGPEVGTGLVAKRDAAAEDVLFGPVPLTPDVLHFHNDEIHMLPPSAQLLAASPQYDNQAFRVGSSAYGLQFHIETTTDVVLDWARRSPELAELARPGQLVADRLDEFHADLADTWHPFVQRFVEFAQRPPDQRGSRRFLPLA